jgi:hypothetical protein
MNTRVTACIIIGTEFKCCGVVQFDEILQPPLLYMWGTAHSARLNLNLLDSLGQEVY